MRLRCPHDGATCHHECNQETRSQDERITRAMIGDGTRTGACMRRVNGMSLSSPWPGFPVDGDAPIPEGPVPEDGR